MASRQKQSSNDDPDRKIRTQRSRTSTQQFIESDSNRIQAHGSRTQQQFVHIASQSSDRFARLPHHNMLNIGQTVSSGTPAMISANQAASYNSFSGSVTQQRNSHPLPASPHYNMENIGDPDRMRNFLEDCLSYPSNSEFSDQPIVNQSLIPQPVESVTCETKELQPLPQAFIQNPNKRRLEHSDSTEPFESGPHAIQHPRSQPITKDTCYPRPGNSTGMDNLMSKAGNIPSGPSPNNVSRMKPVDVRMIQYPCAERDELVNIFVHGPENWTSKFLKTFSEVVSFLRVDTVYGPAFQYYITRGEIPMSVSVRKIADLKKNIDLLKSCCLHSKSTIILCFNFVYFYKQLFDTIRRDISQSLPVMFVGTNFRLRPLPNQRVLENSEAKARFKKKALYNLSACMECSVDSKKDVEAVMLTAIDVSFLS